MDEGKRRQDFPGKELTPCHRFIDSLAVVQQQRHSRGPRELVRVRAPAPRGGGLKLTESVHSVAGISDSAHILTFGAVDPTTLRSANGNKNGITVSARRSLNCDDGLTERRSSMPTT